MTGPQTPATPAGDGLSAARARAAELGVTVSEYVRDQLRRARGDEAWERALAAAGDAEPVAVRELDLILRRARLDDPAQAGPPAAPAAQAAQGAPVAEAAQL